MNSQSNIFFKNVYLLLRGNMLFQIITILTLTQITRIFSSNSIGVYVVFCSVTTILGSISTGRLELALMLPKSKLEANNIYVTGRSLSLIIGALSFLFIIANIFFGFFERIGLVYLFLPLTIVLLGNSLLQNQLLNRNEKFKEAGAGKVVFGLATSIFQLSFGFFINDELILIIGYFIGLLSMNLYFHLSLKSIITVNFISVNRFKVILFQNKLFPTINNLGSFFNLFANQGPVILIESFFGATLAAYFSIVQKSLNAPSSLLSRAFSDVFFKKVTDVNSTSVEIRVFVKKTLKYFALIVFVSTIVIVFFGEFLYSNIFGEEYIASAAIAKIMILFFMIRFVVTSLNSIVIAKGWLKSDLKFNIYLFLSQVVPLLVGYYCGITINIIIMAMTFLGVLTYGYLGFLVYLGINHDKKA